KDYIVTVIVPIAVPVATMPIPAAMPIPAMPIPAVPAHSWVARHSGAPTHETMATTAASTARRSCENWSSEHHCNNATQEKQKFRIIHNQSGFLSTLIRHRARFKVSFYFYGLRRIK